MDIVVIPGSSMNIAQDVTRVVYERPQNLKAFSLLNMLTIPVRPVPGMNESQ
jgi:hypothetical protein